MQHTIASQLGLDMTTVANFFMNARRRGVDRFRDHAHISHQAAYRAATAAAVASQQTNHHGSTAYMQYGGDHVRHNDDIMDMGRLPPTATLLSPHSYTPPPQSHHGMFHSNLQLPISCSTHSPISVNTNVSSGANHPCAMSNQQFSRPPSGPLTFEQL
jgi:hypothetical protein